MLVTARSSSRRAAAEFGVERSDGFDREME